MGHSNGQITAPVNTDDVSLTLGVSSHDVGTLCTSDKINKFSKRKPYPINTPVTLSEAQLRNINYSMTPAWIRYVDFDAPDKGLAPWGQWRLPTTAGWFRLDDFVGYNHQAVPHVKSLSIYSTAGRQYTKPIYKSGSTSQTAGLIAEAELDGIADLKFDDFTVDGMSLGDMYFTLVLMSIDYGGMGLWVAQSEFPIKTSYGKTTVFMETTAINIDALQNLGENVVVAGLHPKISINADYTSNDFVSSNLLVSLDMWNNKFVHLVLNDGVAEQGTGGSGGSIIVSTVEIWGRFLYTPAIDFEFMTWPEGTELVFYGATRNITEYTKTLPDGSIPGDAQLYVSITLDGLDNQQPQYLPDININNWVWNSNSFVLLDNYVVDKSFFEHLRGTGRYQPHVRFFVDIKNQTGDIRYEFKGPDGNGWLSQEVLADPITL